MNLNEYIADKRAKAKGKVSADAVERWNTRILPQRLHTLGESGAAAYLRQYGRGIAAPKCIALALKAEAEGAVEFALGFWKKAYTLETGQPPKGDDGTPPATPTAPIAPPPSPGGGDGGALPFPSHLQPGRLVTMQPIDAQRPRAFYIENDAYCGQPKRDGLRCVVFAAPDRVWYQSRSTNLLESPAPEMDAALRLAAVNLGPFILDAERVWISVAGSEHRTGAQAATVNARRGQSETLPQVRCSIFKALYSDGRDLTALDEKMRLDIGADIGRWLTHRDGDHFEVLTTAYTCADKQSLADRQRAESREGEVWIHVHAPYTGGKDLRGIFVRTKYLQTLDVVVLNLTPTTAAGRRFGAIEVGVHRNGLLTSLGAVGTGFDSADQSEIARLYAERPNELVITVASQGRTEDGKLWHARFLGLRPDKAARDCVEA